MVRISFFRSDLAAEIDFFSLFESLPDHHFCPLPCHAPSSCPETEPCSSLVTVTCPCGRIKHPVRCGRSSAMPSPSQTKPKCTTECAIAKRNARLAEALGITPTNTPNAAAATSASSQSYGGLVNTTNYGEDVIGFARANMRFLVVVERAFAEFVSSPKRTQVLPHMPPERRKFVHDVSDHFIVFDKRLELKLYVFFSLRRIIELIRNSWIKNLIEVFNFFVDWIHVYPILSYQL